PADLTGPQTSPGLFGEYADHRCAVVESGELAFGAGDLPVRVAAGHGDLPHGFTYSLHLLAEGLAEAEACCHTVKHQCAGRFGTGQLSDCILSGLSRGLS